MHTELNRDFLRRFIAPEETPLMPHLAMPARHACTAATHDFLVLIQLPDVGAEADRAEWSCAAR